MRGKNSIFTAFPLCGPHQTRPDSKARVLKPVQPDPDEHGDHLFCIPLTANDGFLKAHSPFLLITQNCTWGSSRHGLSGAFITHRWVFTQP